ncbi:MAG: SDR family oxidoreductase [Bacteroidia bacterium]|nr:SDR family oxidoreductase [Bacteroidia bacterium]
MKNFQGKVVVITGAGSGIGRALALQLAEKGAFLALNDYKAESLEQTLNLLPPGHEKYIAADFDVSDREQMKGFAQVVINKFGVVDMLINNAGVALRQNPFEEVEMENFDRLHEINFGGVVNGCHAFLPHLQARPEAALVNVASVLSFGGLMRSSAYVSSKFAVYGFTQCLIQENLGSGLQVHSVHPAGVKTNISSNSLNPQKSFDEVAKRVYRLSPEFAAKKIIRGIQRKKSRILIGRDAYLLDLITRLSPIGGASLLNNFMRNTRNAKDKVRAEDPTFRKNS